MVSKESITPFNTQRAGIDTSVLISLIVKDIDLLKFREKVFSPNDSLYYAMKTKREFRGVLLNRFKFKKKEKNKAWKRVKSSLGLNPIRIGKKNISEYLNKVREANALLIKKAKPQLHKYYKIGEEDIQIIASFLKWKISKIYTSDMHFIELVKFSD